MTRIVMALFEIVFVVVSEVVSGLFDFIVTLISSSRKTEFNADFIPVSRILNREEYGFCLDGKLCLSITESHKNGLILGGSGSGKSTTVLINSVLLMAEGNSSLIINDPSHELRLLVSGALMKQGYTIKVVDYSNIKSECFNPIKRCTSVSEIQKLSSLLIRNALGEGKDPFWNKSAEGLLSLFIRYLVFYRQPEYRTFYNVLHLINVFAGNPEKIDSLIILTKDAGLITEYKAFVAYGDKTLSSIIATTKASLSLFSDETVAKITSIDTIDFAEFRSKKIALFINNSVPDMHYYGSLSSLFFQQFLNELLLKVPGKDENNIFFLIDEASSMFLPGLSSTVSNIRKFRAGILLVYQDYHQLEHIYGVYEAKNISANCYAKVYLPGQPIETCKILETTLGKFEYEDDKQVRQIRQLMMADEIRMTDRAILLIGNKPAIHAKLHPFYNNRKLKPLTEIPAFEVENTLPFDTPPMIKFGDEEED